MPASFHPTDDRHRSSRPLAARWCRSPIRIGDGHEPPRDNATAHSADRTSTTGKDRAVTHLSSVPGDPPSREGGSGGASLAELLKRSGRGDEAAFAEWYDATASRAFGLAVRVLRDRAQAEEVVQE